MKISLGFKKILRWIGLLNYIILLLTFLHVYESSSYKSASSFFIWKTPMPIINIAQPYVRSVFFLKIVVKYTKPRIYYFNHFKYTEQGH